MRTKSLPDNSFSGSAQEAEPLLDIEQAARFLNVSETSLRRWTNDGRLACLRVGRRRERRFRKADLLAFMEQEPAGRSSPAHGAATGGIHLCGLYSSDAGQVEQAVAFLLDGFRPDTVSYVLGSEELRGRVLAGLKRRYPAVLADLGPERLVLSDYAASAAEQLLWWETRMQEAVSAGATALRVVGDAGAFARAASRDELLQYEADYDARITRRFPVVTMCQYDAREFSGLAVLDTLKAHTDCFRFPAERVLA
ncbi:MAG TPA: MEDS domain-containing protein [Gemmatimonadales bacterium]|nr:MEDS domain-containing protein [Gemmatimonadales bacterium]